MIVPYPTFVALGLAVGMLGAGYVLASQPDATTPPTAAVPKAADVATAATPAAPTAKPTSTLVANRAPVPLTPRTHTTYYALKEAYAPKEAAALKEANASVQTASATSGPTPARTTSTDGSTASAVVGASLDGGSPPSNGATTGSDAKAKSAIELDGYKNVRALEKGPDGTWRGRAMRGRTEITVRVDASGSVSAE